MLNGYEWPGNKANRDYAVQVVPVVFVTYYARANEAGLHLSIHVYVNGMLGWINWLFIYRWIN